MSETRYSSDGPVCPDCGREFVPDEASWFEDGPVDCDECGTQFRMEVENNPTWRTYVPEQTGKLLP